MKRASIILLALVAPACTTQPAKPDTTATGLKKPEASIPFVNQDSSIYTWQADGVDGIWIQDGHRKWYYAKLFAPCIGLDFANSVGFGTRTTSTLDRFSYLIVPGDHTSGRCQFQSLTESDPPPGGKKHGKPDTATEKPADAQAPAQ